MISAMPALMRTALKLPLKSARASREKLTGPAPGTVLWAQLVKSERIDPHRRPTAHDIALLPVLPRVRPACRGRDAHAPQPGV